MYHCPILLMHLDLDILSIHLLILKEKLMLYHHVANLKENAVARRVQEISQKFHFPGLHLEVSHFLTKHEIIDVNSYSNSEWKKKISQLIADENREFHIENAKRYKKIDYVTLSCEEAGIKEYFSTLDLYQSRLKFKERAACMTSCKRQFSSLEENLKTSFFCNSCLSEEQIDVISHWRRCSSYLPYRMSRNLDDDSQLMSYYQDILNHRKAEENI